MSSTVKKAFRHLHNALTGSDNAGAKVVAKVDRVSAEEFHRREQARQKQREARLQQLRLRREEEAEQVRIAAAAAKPCQIVCQIV